MTLLSARLSTTAVNHLLTEIRAKAVITSSGLVGTVKKGLEKNNLDGESDIKPEIYLQAHYEDDLQHNLEVRVDISRPAHFISEKDRDVLIMHSSGTTGLPKPIYHTHRYLLAFTLCHERTDFEDIAGLNLSTLPLYHVRCYLNSVGRQS